ncbi:polyamine-modulated factor 1 isoform X2 [Meriones unguiculatus]|uniref:polyamine-modulated factor 1 isoform X2 n=1 Tax=Meriones unguiculatus TaxID=10047 RepID=UPI000B4F21CC|nr:polyamine-modulated factor 1 isoform X2 [Meriones unguiculatus]
MAEVSRDNETVEKGPEGTSPESVPVDATVSRVKLLDTIVDTFLQKLVAARSYERFTSCYKHFYQLNPEVTRQVYDKFVAQLQTSIREEISEIKQEGNLEAVLNSLDEIVEEGKAHGEPACNRTPYVAECGNRRPRTRNWLTLSWSGAGGWKSWSSRFRSSSRHGRLCTESRGSYCQC